MVNLSVWLNHGVLSLNMVSGSAVRVFLDEKTIWIYRLSMGFCQSSPWAKIVEDQVIHVLLLVSLLELCPLLSLPISSLRFWLPWLYTWTEYSPVLSSDCWQHRVKAPPSLWHKMACHSLSLSLRLTDHGSIRKCTRDLSFNQVQKENKLREDCLEHDTFAIYSCQ